MSGNHSVLSDAQVLLQKIQLNAASASREVEGVYIQRTGLSPVTSGEIEEILAKRKAAVEQERVQRLQDDLSRGQAEYSDILRAPRGEQPPQTTFQPALPLADVDGRAALLAPLKTLFRITLIRCRVQERLSKISEKTATKETNVPSRGVKSVLHRLYCVHKFPICSVEEDELQLRAFDNAANTGKYSLFHNFDSFSKHEFRSPFRFKTKNYNMVRFPEFSLDLTAEASKEVDMFHNVTESVSDIPTLRHFTQPAVTLERFKMPKHAYNFLPASRYGEFELMENNVHSQKAVATAKGAANTLPECSAASAIHLTAGFSSLPPKMSAGAVEDSLSDSESDDGILEHGFQPDLGWVPNVSSNAANSPARSQKGNSTRNVNSAAFSHFMEKYA